jgi:hypothetical protein
LAQGRAQLLALAEEPLGAPIMELVARMFVMLAFTLDQGVSLDGHGNENEHNPLAHVSIRSSPRSALS